MQTDVVLPLEEMTVAEKMDVLDRIMDDLSRNDAAVPVIDWHGEVLAQRERALKTGEDQFITLDEAVDRIRKKTGR